MNIYTPIALVLGCNTPYGIGVLSDWIEEQTGYPPDFIMTSWSDDNDYGYGCGDSYGRGCGDSYGDGSGNGCGYGNGYSYGVGDGYSYGNGYGRGNGHGY